MSEPILHHYDFSPFSEKIRLIFGLKSLTWDSVEIPSILPKQDLVALTGGYRHTPVLQMGADIYCDTRLIARELERRYPDPVLFNPDTIGLALAVEAWAERDLFWPIARYVSGTNADRLDPRLHADRAAMRGKRVPTSDRLKEVAIDNLTLVQVQLPRVANMLERGQDYLISDRLTIADLAVYHALWFLSAMPIDCSDCLSGFPKILTWMDRIKSVGHGRSRGRTSVESLQIAGRSTPATAPQFEPRPSDPPPGARIAIRPDEYLTDDVVGEFVFGDTDEVAIRRRGDVCGDVVVHFPRVGYIIKRLGEHDLR